MVSPSMCHAAGAWMDIMDFNETLGKLFLLVKLGRNEGHLCAYGQKIMTQYFFCSSYSPFKL